MRMFYCNLDLVCNTEVYQEHLNYMHTDQSQGVCVIVDPYVLGDVEGRKGRIQLGKQVEFIQTACMYVQITR